jgi:hypothetical protein
MRKIAPDVERLMWLVAEERDPRAVADFEARFPDLKYELAKHIAMVNGLKSAGRKVPPHSIPRFVPKHAAPRQPIARTFYVAFAVVAAAVALGSVAVNSMMSKPSPPTAVYVPPKNLNSVTPVNPGTFNPPVKPPDTRIQSVPPTDPDQSVPTPDKALHPTALGDPLLRPVSLPNGTAPLEVAVRAICKQAGMAEPVFAPNMPKIEVTLNYTEVPAGDVLADLGRKYGFTTLPHQENDALLLIPARPVSETKAASESSTEHSGPVSVRPPLKRTSGSGQ